MTWICPQCGEELGEYNGWCEYCKHARGIIVYNPDKYFVRDIRDYHIIEETKVINYSMNREEVLAHIEADTRMTPAEKLYAKFFLDGKTLVKDMDTLTMRAFREELSETSSKAKAYIYAIDEEEKGRKSKDNDSKPKGFERSVNIDETTTNAINAIKSRTEKMSKTEKIKANLRSMYEKSGMSAADAAREADRLSTAGIVLARLKNPTKQETEAIHPPTQPLTFNPFEKKS